MNDVLKQVLVSRLKSFLWRAFGMGVVAVLAWMASNVGGLELPTVHVGAIAVDLNLWVTSGLGLVLGEATKYFNNNVPWMRSQLQ